MSQQAAWIGRMLLRELEAFQRELALFTDESLIWRVVPGVTNSAGNLALHVCGSLQFFIGAVLGLTGYTRNRDYEFSARQVSRDELLRELRATMDVVRTVTAALTDERLAEPFPETVGGARMETGLLLTHCCAHVAFHLGQAGYLRRVLTEDNQSAGPLPLQALAMR